MIKKLLFILSTFFIIFSSSFATTYTISKEDYLKAQNITNKIINIVEIKYAHKKNYVYQKFVDTIDGYLALHPDISERKKILLLCLKTAFIQRLGYKVGNSIKVIIKE